jgi:hypothetical protein
VRRLRLAVVLAAAFAPCAGAPASAHWVTPEEVVAELDAPATRTSLDVLSVARDARLPRLLVVRVGPRWTELDPALRREAAESWRELWRHAVPDGVLAVTDASGRSLVSFDAAGRAQLRDGARGGAVGDAPGG